MEQYKGKLQLVNTFTESRLFRTKQNQNKTNVDDAAELTFAYMMILNMFNKTMSLHHWHQNMLGEQSHTVISITLEQAVLTCISCLIV